MFHIILILLYIIIAIVLIVLKEKNILKFIPDKAKAGLIISLFFVPLAMLIPAAITFIPRLLSLYSFPALLTYLVISTNQGTKLFEQMLGVTIYEDDLTFLNFFSNRFAFSIISSIYLLFLILYQMTVLPIFNFRKHMPMHTFGQLLPISIFDLPRVIMFITAFGIFPLFISGQCTKAVTKMLDPNDSEEEKETYIESMRILGTLLGFLLGRYVLTILTPIDIIVPLIIVISLISTPGMQKMLKLFKLPMPKEAISPSQIFSSDEALFTFTIIYLIFVSLSLLVGPTVPLYNYIYALVKTSNFKSFIEVIFQLFILWFVPYLIGKSMDNSLKRTSGKKNTKKVEQTNGYALGHFIGVLIMLSIYTFLVKEIGSKLEKFMGKSSMFGGGKIPDLFEENIGEISNLDDITLSIVE